MNGIIGAIQALVLCLIGAAVAIQQAEILNIQSRLDRTMVAATHASSGKFSRLSWPELTQEQTIALGESLKERSPGQVTIYCSSPNCQALRTDFDDALQIADWKSDFEDRFVDSESDVGLFVGPSSNPKAVGLANAISEATGIVPNFVEIDDTKSVGLIIGRKP